MKDRVLPALIIALDIVVLGLCMKGGMDNFILLSANTQNGKNILPEAL